MVQNPKPLDRDKVNHVVLLLGQVVARLVQQNVQLSQAALLLAKAQAKSSADKPYMGPGSL
jgi:hypothetical protein